MHKNWIGRITFLSLPDRNFGLFVQEAAQFAAKLTLGHLLFSRAQNDHEAWEVSITFEFTEFNQHSANKELQRVIWDLGLFMGHSSQSFGVDWYLQTALVIEDEFANNKGN